ncbi:reverse transcriptase domain-containing protein [Tanacetum coccineum]
MKKLIAELPTLTDPKKEEELMVYLSAANEAVSAVLLVERKGRQTLIHYVSRTLQGAKINYPPMEKLALALVHPARRLRRDLIQAIPTSLPTQPVGEATKASNLQRIPLGVQGRSHFTYFLYLIVQIRIL